LTKLSDIETMFHGNVHGDPEVRKAARSRLQRAYYDLYRKSGQLLKPGVDVWRVDHRSYQALPDATYPEPGR